VKQLRGPWSSCERNHYVVGFDVILILLFVRVDHHGGLAEHRNNWIPGKDQPPRPRQAFQGRICQQGGSCSSSCAGTGRGGAGKDFQIASVAATSEMLQQLGLPPWASCSAIWT
jgi:hypothetical protein